MAQDVVAVQVFYKVCKQQQQFKQKWSNNKNNNKILINKQTGVEQPQTNSWLIYHRLNNFMFEL